MFNTLELLTFSFCCCWLLCGVWGKLAAGSKVNRRKLCTVLSIFHFTFSIHIALITIRKLYKLSEKAFVNKKLNVSWNRF